MIHTAASTEGHGAFLLARRGGLDVYRRGVSSSINAAMHSFADSVSRFWPDARTAARGGVRPLLRVAGHGRRARRDLVLHAALRLSRRRDGDAACQLDRQRFPRRDRARRRRRNAGADASTDQTARWQDTPDQCSVEGCGWDADAGIHRRAGMAVRRLPHHADGRGPRRQADHLPTICSSCRPDAGRKPGRILQVAATGTWTAYNTWGGSNHYQGITGPKRDQFATTGQHRAPAGAAASSCCRRRRRACRWRSRCRR